MDITHQVRDDEDDHQAKSDIGFILNTDGLLVEAILIGDEVQADNDVAKTACNQFSLVDEKSTEYITTALDENVNNEVRKFKMKRMKYYFEPEKQQGEHYKRLCVIKTDDNRCKTLVAMKNQRPIAGDNAIISSEQDMPKNQIANFTDDRNVFFQCMYCNMNFSSMGNLDCHMVTHDDCPTHDTASPCQRCNYHLDELNKHLLTHHEPHADEQDSGMYVQQDDDLVAVSEEHLCDLCGLKFNTRMALLSHHNQHSNVTHQCGLCPASYRTRRTLKLHLFQCHGVGRAFVCSTCGKIFSVRSQLRQHIHSHDETRPFTCEVCSKAYQTEELLKRHQVTHNKRFKCAHCDRAFLCNAQLRRHIDALNDIFEEVCQHCGKKFTSRYYLESHMVVHSDRKDFQCTCCGALFARKSQLKRHNLVHTGERDHVCNKCGKAFPTVNSLSKHARIHFNEYKKPFACEKCGKGFVIKEYLKRHYSNSCSHRNDGPTSG